ncbi:MAG: DUF433 domain-containing protein [Hyphomicrobiales bacterium]|nr:DUF433 domain-containing protein [Hyphomicrobiales bacterium]MBV8827012.1 DUF433 domain-containing protein [Hyphomicrobiales bacterium]MBV9427545.1 DUF433 domain-containing protein [Bradyrhizobiaceae bacterium]
MDLQFSLKEAAAIADVPEPFVRKAVDQKTVRPRVVSSGRAVRYRFGVDDMLFLKVISRFPFDLPRQDKDALRSLVEGRQTRAGKWSKAKTDFVVRNGDLAIVVECKDVRRRLSRDLATYRRGVKRIISDPEIMSGEPVFAGTRISLAHVAALIAKGIPFEELAEDYPALSRADLDFAAIHSKMKRNPGRPRKALRFVRRALPPERSRARPKRP